MTVIIPRAQWGAQPPRWQTPISRSQGMFAHYNGGPVPTAAHQGNLDAAARYLRAIQSYHFSLNWPDVAYSFAVDTQGRIYSLRGWGVAGAHTLNWNDRSHACLFILGGDQQTTEPQWAAFRWLVAEHNRRYGTGFVKGHQEAPNSTSCPGQPVMQGLRAGRGNPTPVTQPPRPVPAPPGVDPKVSKPFIINERPGGNPNAKSNGSWVYYTDTPWRIRIKTADDFRTFRALGVPVRILSPEQHAFFKRNTNEVKTG